VIELHGFAVTWPSEIWRAMLGSQENLLGGNSAHHIKDTLLLTIILHGRKTIVHQCPAWLSMCDVVLKMCDKFFISSSARRSHHMYWICTCS
jgi:hypothetical protein